MGMQIKVNADSKQLIFNVMKEMSKANKMINKGDIFAMISSQIDKKNFESTI